MIKYTFSLAPKTFLLCSNGDTSGTYDAQFVFDENGFPYFPAKTFKGLLRESMIEVLEMSNTDENKIIDIISNLFGEQGGEDFKAILVFNNLYLPKEILDKVSSKTNRNERISYFIKRIQQTALDENDIAEEGSLRQFAVLDFEKVGRFETDFLTNKAISSEYFGFLQNAIKHLRNVGMSRNRGLGRCECTISAEEIKIEPNTNKQDKIEDFDYLKLEIINQEPLVLGTQNADQNTVFSQEYISGNQIWGALAWKYGFETDQFKELFLSNQLTFDCCFPDDAFPVPNSIHREKYVEENHAEVYNILNAELENTITKGIGGMMNQTQKVKIKKSFNFHNSRPNRTAGRSLEGDGSIFYYESINKGTRFTGKISGESALLQKLIDTVGEKGLLNIGRSKSTQYGKVSFRFTKENNYENKSLEKNTYYLVALTPIVLFDDNGFAMPNRKTLADELGIEETKIEKATTGYIAIEQYNGVWQAKTGKWNAYDKGSTFKIEKFQPKSYETYIGALTEKGFGKVRFYSESEMDEKIELIKSELRKDDIKTEKNQVSSRESSIKVLAYQNAEKAKDKLSNSLISRMLMILKTSKNEAELKEKLDAMEGKQAGNTLKDIYLMEDLYQMNTLDGINNKKFYSNHDEYKIYWTAFFQALRKINS